MAEPVEESVSLSMNGETVVKVSAAELENNSESDTSLKENCSNLDESTTVELDTNNSDSSSKRNSTSNEEASSTTFNQSNGAVYNDSCEDVVISSSSAALNSKNFNVKYDGNTYVVSPDSDEERNAQCITMYRDDVIEISDNSDSSDSETSSTVSDDNEDSDNELTSDKSDAEEKKTNNITRTKGEFSLQDLPPIEDLKISVDENKCKPVGSVLNIVEEMVVIQSFPNTPPLDIDTVLFLDRGQRALGKIFDVFGPVHEPFYSIRFNSREHIQERNIMREQVVYCAPQTEYTSYIPVSELLKEKGSDASWAENNEPPATCLDFSDDEAEARHKRHKVIVGSKRDTPIDNDLFVRKMNQKNLELTAKRKKEDEVKQKRGSGMRKVMVSPNNQSGEGLMNGTHSFSPFPDAYKMKNRTFTNSNGDQSCATGYFHPAAAPVNTHSSKFESGPRAMNYLRNAAASYTPPLNYTFPSQHFMCSSPRQLPNTAQPSAATPNYLAMYQRPPVPSPAPMPSPFSNFTAGNIPPMPTFVTQASMHPNLPPSFNASVPPPPPPFANFNPLPTPPLPSSLPQPNFFPCADAGAAIRQSTFIPLNMRSGVPPAFHPQFSLPPPPPPPPPVPVPHLLHQREASIGSRIPDRRTIQPSHQTTNTFYPNSPNS